MTATPTSQKPNGEPGRKARPGRTNPFVEKRAQRRQIARARSLSHARVPIHTAFRAHHDQRRMPGWLRAAIGILVLLASVGLHVGFVIMAFGVGHLGAQREKERERLAIEMREHEAEKPKRLASMPSWASESVSTTGEDCVLSGNRDFSSAGKGWVVRTTGSGLSTLHS